MKTYRRFYNVFLLFLLLPLVAWPINPPTFTVSAPECVEAGKPFRLTFTVTSPEKLANTDIKNFVMPKLVGLNVLIGPTQSQATNTQYIEGKISQSYQIAYTYTLSASQTGKYSIPSVDVIVKGHPLHSQPVSVNVVPAGKLPSHKQPEVFITMNISERSPRINTPVILECKLYTTIQVDSLTNLEQLILSDDFRAEPIDLRGGKWQVEQRNKKNYQTLVFRKLLLYPLHAGEIHIGDLYMDVYGKDINVQKDPFEAFFENGNNYLTVKRRVSCQGITIHVRE